MAWPDRSRRWAAAVALVSAASVVTVFGQTPDIATAALSPDPSSSIANGNNHQCVVIGDQTVNCWGANDRGQLGDGTTIDSLAPVTVQGLSDVVSIDAGADFTCALTAAGTIGCWGRDTSGSLGDPGAGPYESTPTFANGLDDAVEIAVGETHACARRSSGSVVCWGDNDDEQLGDGTSIDTAVPVTAIGIDDAVQISAGAGTTCAVRTGHTLACWGYNDTGLFGNGTTDGSAVPLDIPEAGAVVNVEVALVNTCVISDSGAARCTGSGPRGDGESSGGPEFVDVDLPPVLDLSVGGEVCAIAPNATVWCWGSDFRLIDGTTSGAIAAVNSSASPTLVDGLESVTAVDAGRSHSCAATVDGDVLCWGVNVGGELQIEPKIIEDPGAIVPGVSAKQLSIAPSACAVTVTDTVTCWGVDLTAEFTSGSFSTPTPPSPIDDVTDAVDVSTASVHACAALADGTVTCWGLNFAGELGFPAPPDPYSDVVVHAPTPVDGITDATEVATGNVHSCSAGGQYAHCWGNDASGELGNGPPLENSASPVQVTAQQFTYMVDLIASGSNHSCARNSIGFSGVVLMCWGSNSMGQLGDGTTTDRDEPVYTGIAIPKSVAAGDEHSCAIDSADDLFCWGLNSAGQVGNGIPSASVSVPTQVMGLPATPVEVAAGSEHSCALLADTTVACWGSNEFRQTGQTVFGNVVTPTIVPNLTGVVHIAAGFQSTCAILSDATVTCWGSNQWGTAGTNPIVAQPRTMNVEPVSVPGVLTTERIFHPVTPARLLETRDGLVTHDGASQGGGAVRGGTSIEFQVTGRAGVPADARFALINVTAVRPQSSGFFTVHGCLSARPNVASLNFTNQGGDGPINLGNETIVELSPTGTACVFTSATTDITVDVSAFGTSAGAYAPTVPARLLDSRPEKVTVDGEFELGSMVEGGTEVELEVTGRAGIDEGAESAVLYVAAVNPTGVGFITAHPCLPELPTASSLNVSVVPGAGGINRGNEILAPLSADGHVCLYVSTTTHLTVDVMGSTGATTTYQPVSPARLLETRLGQSTVDGIGERGAALAGGSQIELAIAGRAGIAAGARLAVLNITAVRPTGTGFVTAHPCEPTLPTASSLNFAAPPVSGPINGGNEVVVPLSDTGTVCLFVSTTTHLTVDAVGFS